MVITNKTFAVIKINPKLMQNIYIQIILLIAVFALSAGCKKNSTVTPVNTAAAANPIPVKPVITGISTLSGLPGLEVVINGADFNANKTADTVTFNGIVATITLATDTAITVIVPATAATGKIVLKTNNTSLTYPTDFKVSQLTKINFGPWNISNMAVDAAGNIYNYRGGTVYVLKPSASGLVQTTLATINALINGLTVDANNVYVSCGYDNNPYSSSNYYVQPSSPVNNYYIYKITPLGVASVFAGNGIQGNVDGPGISAEFTAPTNLALPEMYMLLTAT